MEPVMEIHLQKTRFFGYHGLNLGEEIVGGEFEVDVIASYIPSELPVHKLEHTVDYVQLYDMVKQKMKKPVFLLETLATEIASEIIAKFSIVTEVSISISKLHPPIENFEGSVGVTFKIKRN